MGLKSQGEWKEYCNSGKKPADIPNYPSDVLAYKKYWKGWGDWLGTGYIASTERVYRPFPKARKFVDSLGLKNTRKWEDYCNSGKKPAGIPNYPSDVLAYKKYWKGWGDWLGTGTIEPSARVYRSFHDAREFYIRSKLKARKTGEIIAIHVKNPRTYQAILIKYM